MNRYFDNAATSWPKAPGVAEAVEKSIREGIGNPSRSLMPIPNRVLFDVREAIATLIHANDSSRIAFGLNATQMINIALLGTIRDGDRIITTSMEHNAVARPLRFLERTRRIDLEIIRCSPEGYLDPDDLRRELNRAARLVVINHSSNVTGALNNLGPIGRVVKEAGALFMVDCAQSVGAAPIAVDTDQIDILAGPGHKSLLGPSGTGFLYVSDRITPDPLIYGGTGSYSELDVQPDVLPDRYESGTQNFHGLSGLLVSLDFINQTGIAAIQKKERHIAERVLNGLSTIHSLRLLGPKSVTDRTLTFSVDMYGKDVAALANQLAHQHGIITRTGLHCAPWAHKTAGSYPGGSVRISPGFFHQDSDIDYLLDVLERSAEVCK